MKFFETIFTRIDITYEISFIGTCSALGLSNGRVDYNTSAVNGRYPVDTSASFTCNSGYTRSGSSSSICQNSGGWNEYEPTCNKGKYFTLQTSVVVVKIVVCSPIYVPLNL